MRVNVYKAYLYLTHKSIYGKTLSEIRDELKSRGIKYEVPVFQLKMNGTAVQFLNGNPTVDSTLLVRVFNFQRKTLRKPTSAEMSRFGYSGERAWY